MKTSKIRIKAEKFRAVRSADIIIDGITVVAGENGSGKSSISKLIYYLYKTVSNYDSIVLKNLSRSLRDVQRFMEIFEQELSFSIRDRKIRNDFRKEIYEARRGLFGEKDDLQRNLKSWMNLVDMLENVFHDHEKEEIEFLKKRLVRVEHILNDLVQDKNKQVTIEESFNILRELILNKFKGASGIIASRPISIFKEELYSVFTDGVLPSKFEVLEFEEEVVSLSKDNVAIPYSIQKAFYIDTPMMLSVDSSSNDYWDDLNESLIDKTTLPNSISNLISNDVIHGDIHVDESIYSASDLKFTRKDGKTFILNDVATGIKAFSIIQILLKNGSIDDKTLLIIDEPESHLHPQWIIEYARLIVLLNKKIGVKFFIASHNPDFVSAIRFISEKEGSLEDLNFYLANKNEKSSFEYDYKHLENDIDPIFESFNIAIDRINQYGV
jgi:predicted ATP-dependent endonuclease of OLD family